MTILVSGSKLQQKRCEWLSRNNPGTLETRYVSNVRNISGNLTIYKLNFKEQMQPSLYCKNY